MENEKPMRRMKKDQPGVEENQESVWCHRSQKGENVEEREGVGVVDTLGVGPEVVAEDSSVLWPECGQSLKQWQVVGIQRPGGPSSKRALSPYPLELKTFIL